MIENKGIGVRGEGGIRSGRSDDSQRFKPEFNRQKLQKHSKPGVQVQNRYSDLRVGNPPACREICETSGPRMAGSWRLSEMTKVIAPAACIALKDALSTVYWYKS